jgi:hypothetical protein
MNTLPIDIPGSGPLPAAFTRLGAGAMDFEQQLKTAAAMPEEDQQARLDSLRKSSEQLVATTFIMPMLAQMRDDPFKSDLFHGGQTEDIFGQQMDTILAERIVAKADFSIVDALYRTIAERASLPVGETQGVDTHG